MPTVGLVPMCGNCKQLHATAADVRDCYARDRKTGTRAAEIHGRRVLAHDGANDITARFLRAGATPSEKILWRWIGGGFRGYRFECQVPLFGYVVDFYCATLQLAVEVDGSSHRDRAELDRLRDDWIGANYVRVLRLPARLVHQDIQQALRLLNTAMRKRAAVLGGSIACPVAAAPTVRCRHGHDSLLCQKCKRVEQHRINLALDRAAVAKRRERRYGTGSRTRW